MVMVTLMRHASLLSVPEIVETTFTSAFRYNNWELLKLSFRFVVPGPPGGVKASVRSSNSIVVSWLPPEFANGVVQRYHVYVR